MGQTASIADASGDESICAAKNCGAVVVGAAVSSTSTPLSLLGGFGWFCVEEGGLLGRELRIQRLAI